MNYELICIQETELARKISKQLGKDLHTTTLQQFADGEINVELNDPALFRDKIAVIIQSTGIYVNEHTLAVAYCAHELKNAGAYKVIAVIPYFGYGRQERSTIQGKSGHAAVVAKLFEGAGIDEIVAVELHELSLIDLFSIPVHNIRLQHVIAQHIKQRLNFFESTCLIAPDHGAHAYVEDIARVLSVPVLLFEKERYGKDKTRVISQEIASSKKVGIMVDDIIATGGTAIHVCNMLHEQGFTMIYGYFVHPVLAGPALERLHESHFEKIFVGNTLPLSPESCVTGFIESFDVSNAITEKLQDILYEKYVSHTFPLSHDAIK
jgi:ribose-phosphate pyrophosphokinase